MDSDIGGRRITVVAFDALTSVYALTIIVNVTSRLDILPNTQSRSTRAETSQGNKIARHFHHTSMHLHVYNGGHSTQCITTI